VMRLAEALLSASIMMSCSIMASFTGALWDWITKASQPRTDSWNCT